MNEELLVSDIENVLNKMNDRQLKDLGYEFLHTGIISIRALTAERFEKKVLNKANEVCNQPFTIYPFSYSRIIIEI